MNRTDPTALKKAGNKAFGLGRFAEAVEHYTAAIDLWMAPEDRAVLYCNRSAARLKLPGEKPKAISDANRACELAPTYAKAHFRRGQALRAMGDPAAAAEAMRRVLELAPGDAAATVELTELEGALGAAPKVQLEGHLQAGMHVPSSRVKERLDEPKARIPGAHEAYQKHLVTERDVSKIAGTSNRFFDSLDAVKEKHEEAAAPLRPKKKPEMFPGCPWPEGYGPHEPGWDPTYKPIWQGAEHAKEEAELLAKQEKEAVPMTANNTGAEDSA